MIGTAVVVGALIAAALLFLTPAGVEDLGNTPVTVDPSNTPKPKLSHN
ncbi:hypothetical protein GCM10010123_12330 [Pilimelia anulata]|uniref:Uncharacterized protein n=1 Tax=Pilimelia anulata TaxID=53371 RepID=A0A8J3B8T8_9ACTN|nr:hypothetical protein [Pilimelia anulata]GGJ84203.1 hypothetical protein GCM10010123_12330 [Pilimelia anulata]